MDKSEKPLQETRAKILESAQKFIYSKGYEEMTIQDVLDDLSISKGAFYHYFNSKQELLFAIIDQMVDAALQMLLPIITDDQLTPIQKLSRYFVSAGRWKVTQKDFLIQILTAWYKDENILVRQKLTITGLRRITPLLQKIIEEGIASGDFHVSRPEHIGGIIFTLMNGMADTIGQELIDHGLVPEAKPRWLNWAASYAETIERILGAPSGSIVLIEPEVIQAWFA